MSKFLERMDRDKVEEHFLDAQDTGPNDYRVIRVQSHGELTPASEIDEDGNEIEGTSEPWAIVDDSVALVSREHVCRFNFHWDQGEVSAKDLYSKFVDLCTDPSFIIWSIESRETTIEDEFYDREVEGLWNFYRGPDQYSAEELKELRKKGK